MSSCFTTVRGAHGLDLNVRRWNLSAPRVLLLHGFGDGSFVWEPFARQLAHKLPAAAPDLRGHGDSAWDPARRYTMNAHLADAEQVIAALQPAELIIIGHSLGAEIAIRLAAAHPARMRALVIVDGGPDLKAEAIRYLYQQFAAQPWHYSSVQAFTESLALRLPLADRSILEEFAANALRAGATEGRDLKCDPALTTELQSADSSDLWDALRAIECPTLLVRGAASAILPDASAIRISQSLRNCRLVRIPVAGHAVMLDNPAAFFTAVQPFLLKVTGRDRETAHECDGTL